MATRDEVKSELMSKIDNAVPDDRELDQDGDTPLLAQALGLSDEDTDDLLDEIDSADADDEDAGESDAKEG
jgi:hypothetical protein